MLVLNLRQDDPFFIQVGDELVCIFFAGTTGKTQFKASIHASKNVSIKRYVYMKNKEPETLKKWIPLVEKSMSQTSKDLAPWNYPQ